MGSPLRACGAESWRLVRAVETSQAELHMLKREICEVETLGFAAQDVQHWRWEIQRLRAQLNSMSIQQQVDNAAMEDHHRQAVRQAQQDCSAMEATAQRSADAQQMERVNEVRRFEAQLESEMSQVESQVLQLGAEGETHRRLSEQEAAELARLSQELILTEEAAARHAWGLQATESAGWQEQHCARLLQAEASDMEQALEALQPDALVAEAYVSENLRMEELNIHRAQQTRASRLQLAKLQSIVRQINPALASQLIREQAPALRMAASLRDELSAELKVCTASTSRMRANLVKRRLTAEQNSELRAELREMNTAMSQLECRYGT